MFNARRPYAKVMQSVATIKRSFKYITIDLFNILFITYIQPHIEHCIQAWSPYYAKDRYVGENSAQCYKIDTPISKSTYLTKKASSVIHYTVDDSVET